MKVYGVGIKTQSKHAITYYVRIWQYNLRRINFQPYLLRRGCENLMTLINLLENLRAQSTDSLLLFRVK